MNPNINLLREARLKLLEFTVKAYLHEDREEIDKIIGRLEQLIEKLK